MNEENKNNEEVSESVETPAEELVNTTAAEAPIEGEITETVETEAAEAEADAAADEEPVIVAEDALIDTEKSGKGISNRAVAGIAAGVVVIIAAVVIFLVITKFIGGSNSYNDKYIDIDGTTAADMANNQCMEYDEYLEFLHLPSDLPEDTNSNAAQNLIPIGRWIELQGSTFEQFKEMCSWDDSITEDTTYGDAIDSTALKYVVGEEQLDYFKQLYGLDSDVTADTKFGEIRKTVDEFSRKQYEDQKKQQEEAEQAAADDTDDADDTDADDNAESETDDQAEPAENVEQTEEKVEEKVEEKAE